MLRFGGASPNGSGFAAGDPVAIFPLISCGRCNACRSGHSHVCSRLRLYGIDADGGMAEWLKVPAANLVRLPREMPVPIGALIEPLAVAVHAVKRASWSDGKVSVVIGAGPIGLLTALVAQARGLERVLISDVAETRLAVAREMKLEALPASELREAVDSCTNGEGAELVFECAGSTAAAREMTALTRPRGTIVNVSVFKKPAELDLQAINFKELTLVGTRVYTREDFEDAIALVGRLPLEKLITHTFALEEAQEGYRRFAGGEGCKFLIQMNR